MSPEPNKTDAGFDPDEDLFDFGDPTALAPAETEESEDLEEIFAAFHEEEAKEQELAGAQASLAPDVPASAQPPLAAPATAPLPAPAAAAPTSAAPAPDPAAARSNAPAPIATPLVAAPPAAPAHVHLAPAPATSAAGADPERGRRSRVLIGTSIAILAAIFMMNGLVAFITLRTAAQLQVSLAHENRAPGAAETSAVEPSAGTSSHGEPAALETEPPLVPPDPDGHPVFERVRQDLEQSDYASARRRLYALLSVIDRIDSGTRSEIEARAHYMLARIRHLEAAGRLEEER